jgi:hypothetical protein
MWLVIVKVITRSGEKFNASGAPEKGIENSRVKIPEPELKFPVAPAFEHDST